MLGAVEDRLAAQAPVVMVSHSMQGGCLCENAPGLRIRFSNMEIAAAAAPRPQLLVAATGDWTRTTPTLEGPAIEAVYRLFDAAPQFRHVCYDFGHNYNQTSRETVAAWFARWLQAEPDAMTRPEKPYAVEPDAALQVFADGVLPPTPSRKRNSSPGSWRNGARNSPPCNRGARVISGRSAMSCVRSGATRCNSKKRRPCCISPSNRPGMATGSRWSNWKSGATAKPIR